VLQAIAERLDETA